MKIAELGKWVLGQLKELAARAGKYVELCWNKINGRKTVSGLVLIAIGYYLESDEAVLMGLELLGLGFLHKFYKEWKKKSTNNTIQLNN